jgi:hypothetical protein
MVNKSLTDRLWLEMAKFCPPKRIHYMMKPARHFAGLASAFCGIFVKIQSKNV